MSNKKLKYDKDEVDKYFDNTSHMPFQDYAKDQKRVVEDKQNVIKEKIAENKKLVNELKKPISEQAINEGLFSGLVDKAVQEKKPIQCNYCKTKFDKKKNTENGETKCPKCGAIK